MPDTIEPSPTLTRYTVVAAGESTSVSTVSLTPLQRDGVIATFNVVNSEAHSSDDYSPMLWLYEYGAVIEESQPLNKPFYFWSEWRGDVRHDFRYDLDGRLFETHEVFS